MVKETHTVMKLEQENYVVDSYLLLNPHFFEITF